MITLITQAFDIHEFDISIPKRQILDTETNSHHKYCQNFEKKEDASLYLVYFIKLITYTI